MTKVILQVYPTMEEQPRWSGASQLAAIATHIAIFFGELGRVGAGRRQPRLLGA